MGTFFVLWLIYRHFVTFLNSSLVGGKIRDYTEKNKQIWQSLAVAQKSHGHVVLDGQVTSRTRPSAFQRATLKSWEWPGDEAAIIYVTTMYGKKTFV